MNKKNIIVSSLLLVASIVFSILVMKVDVKPVGINGSNLGFSTINKMFFDMTSVNDTWYFVTEILGILAICVAANYGFVGLRQWIERKNILKVDLDIIILGGFYTAVIIMYFLFKDCFINYRPVLIDGMMEASYPSSHTLLTIFVFGSAIVLNKKRFKRKNTRTINIILEALTLLTVIGRLMSGYHWFTDVVGGVLMSSTVLMIFYIVMKRDEKEK